MMEDDGIFLTQTQKLYTTDNFGNVLYLRLFESPTKSHRYAVLNLKLKSENRQRHLGYVDMVNGIFYCMRDTSKHYHYKTKSFGFNWSLLNDKVFGIKTICLDVDHDATYTFPLSVLNDYGTFLNFAKQGYELQRFLKFEFIKRYKTNDKITIRVDKEKRVDV
jgi:hypothetical protein